MALGDGGLDAQVEQRMDTYRGNREPLLNSVKQKP